MKKYYTTLNGSDKKNEIELTDNNKIKVNNVSYDYEYKFINKNVLVLRINDINYFLTVSGNEEDGTIDVNVDSKDYILDCKSELDLLIEKMSGNKSSGKVRNEIKSPMPGIIKSMNVKEGQQVNKGDVLLVLEAMKMENEIRAAHNCVVKKIVAGNLSSVEKNELLITLE